MKYDLVVPLAGKGSRMHSDIPKPMIMAGDRTILEWGMESIDTSECQITFIILEEQENNFGLNSFLRDRYPMCQVLIIDKLTRGSVETCLKAKMFIQGQDPLIIFAPDVMFRPVYKPDPSDFICEGKIITFKANSPEYSYILHRDGQVCETQEKNVISQDAALGLYLFKTGNIFLHYAQKMIELDKTVRGEFYICPMYDMMIKLDGNMVAYDSVDDVYIMGTQPELDFFRGQIFPYMDGPKEWVLCSDHSGYGTKERFKSNLLKRHHKVIDVGCHSTKDCDYYDFMMQAARIVLDRPGAYGLGFCRSGQGMNIAANKIHGIRSALVDDFDTAALAVKHNAANFFAIPEYADDERVILGIKGSRFQGGRHQNRLMKVGL